MKLGIASRQYPGTSVLECAEAMEKAGFVWCELCPSHTDLGGWAYNGRTDLDKCGINAKTVAAAAKTFREHGIEPVSLGVFGDLRDPDPDEATADREYFRRWFEFAEAANIPYIASECGFTGGRRGINADTYTDDYGRLKTTLAELLPDASRHGTGIALECCLLDVIPSPRRFAALVSQLYDEYGVDNLKALLDPANYITNADEDDMFKYLDGIIAYIHGKDRLFNSTYGCNIGEGDVNWVRFFENYKAAGGDLPFIFEYCSGEDIPRAIKTANKYYSWAE